MILLEKHLPLDEDISVDDASQCLADLLEQEGIDRKQIMSIRLSVEEALLRWRDHEQSGDFSITLEKKLGGLHLEISRRGSYCDPFEDTQAVREAALGRNILANLGVAFRFNYLCGTNRIILIINKEKRRVLIKLLAAISVAVILGALINSVCHTTPMWLQTSILAPIFDSFTGFLRLIVVPYMFVSVVTGMCSMGDVASLGKVSKALFGKLLLMSLLAAVIAGVIMFLSTNITFGADKSLSLAETFIDILPSGLENIFVLGGSFKVILIAVAVGIALNMTRSASYNIAVLFDELNFVFQSILELISSVIPAFIFINILGLMLTSDISKFSNIWWLFSVFLGTVAICVIIQSVAIPIKEKVSSVKVFKKMLPTFLINLVTASSASSFSTNIACLERQFGVQKSLVKIGLPLGMMVHKPATVIYFSALSVFCANAYAVPITLSSFCMILFVSVILSMAVPPVPGGNLACYTLLFMQVGIPLEAISIAVALDLILDFFITAFDIALLQTQILHSANKLELLDFDKLRKG